MMLINFDDCQHRKDLNYGGMAGAKIAVDYNDEIWLIKFPKSTKEFNKATVSYTTSPVNEYLGSQIYASLGIPVHETLLGYRDGRVVVGCKDFVHNNHSELSEFLEIKNSIVPDEDDPFSLDASGNGTKLSSILYVIDRIVSDPWYASISNMKERFWDMFVADAFIRNNDRNNGNWGVLRKPDGSMELAPVYDNGNAFFSTRSGSQNALRANDEQAIMQDAFGCHSIFEYDNGHRIEPYTFMAKHEYPDCDAAISRFLDRCDMDKVNGIINDVPEQWHGKSILPQGTKDLYKAILQTHHDSLIAISNGEPFSKELKRELVHRRNPMSLSACAQDAQRQSAVVNQELLNHNNSRNRDDVQR